ncbi:MAG: alpha/beta fold hydrolase [Pseudobdellovibrionaceae bacterium]
MPHKISFRERGQGALLILLHGYGGSVHHWEEIAENLSHHYRVVVPNLSHVYMSSNKLFFTVQIEVLAKFVRDHFPGQKVNIAGLSYGGALCWGLALQYPELIEKTVLINPLVTNPVKHFIPKELKFFFALPFNMHSIYLMLSTPLGRNFLKRSAQIFRDERSEGVAAIENLKGRKLQFVAHLIHHFSWILRSEDWNFWNKKMNSYKAECCFIYDQEDLLFRPNAYIEFASRIKCDNVITLTGAGHLAIKTQPNIISKHILDFLNKQNAA